MYKLALLLVKSPRLIPDIPPRAPTRREPSLRRFFIFTLNLIPPAAMPETHPHSSRAPQTLLVRWPRKQASQDSPFFAPLPRRFLFLLIAACVSLFGFGQTTFAETIGWNFTDGDANYDTSTPNNPPNNYTLGAIGIVDSFSTVTSTINSTSNSNGTNGTYSGASGGNNIGTAVPVGAYSATNSAYFTFAFTPSAGYGLQFTNFSFGARSTSTGPQAYALYSSVDNYTNAVCTGTLANGSLWAYKTNSFTLNGAVNAAVTLRLYLYNGTGNATASTENLRLDDIAVTASAISGGVTNPTATATAGSSAVAPGQPVTLSVQVTPGNGPTSTGLTVTGDLSAIGGSSTQAFTAGSNNTFTYTATVPANQAYGAAALPITVTDAQNRSGTASLTLAIAGNLTIFHTNDTHARVTPHYWIVPSHTSNPSAQFELVGGAAYMAGQLLSLVGGQPDALVLDGGDISEGNPVGDWNGPGNPTGTYGNGTSVQFYQKLDTKLRAVAGRGGRGLDAMVVGNHDIRDISYLNNLKNQTNFPVISINICSKGTQTAYFQPYVILNVDGHKIGVVGYTTETSDSPEAAVNNIIDVVKCDWSSTDATKIHFSSVVNDLRNNQGCDLVILLTHDGHSDLCTSSSGSTPILVDDPTTAKLPEIAVTGHWHTYCDTVWQPSVLNYKTIFTEGASFNHYVAELRVTPTGQYISNASYVLRNSTITPDPEIASFVQQQKDAFNATNPPYTTDQIIGYSSSDLLLDNYMKWWSADEYPWSGNNTAGNWICDAFLWKATQLFGQCDLAIESGGGVRSDIPAGPVTYTQIYETYPWADDTIYEVNMTGAEIYNYFQQHGCDVALSGNWFVTAYDGNPTNITFNGQPISMTATYKVAISNYMYLHDSVPFTDPSPQTSTVLGRDTLVQYTAQFGQGSPYNAGPSRYSLNTEFSGGYTAVVMMMNDADSQTDFDDAFIRLLSANSETVGHLGTTQVPTDLVNANGTINRSNRLGEIEMYRSYLGFKTGALHPGDIIQTYGKGSFYNGDPEFVDQEGIQSNGVEFNVIGHDASLAQPSYFSSINGFYNQVEKNHYVKFVAKKTAASQVTDQSGTTISVEDVTGYSSYTLPGSVGDLLVLTGVPTSEYFALRFRCDSAVEASTLGISNYPPDSSINAVTTEQTANTLILTASANIAPGAGTTTYVLSAVADSQISSGSPTSNYGTKTYLYNQSSSTDSFGDERDWLRFDLSSLPANTTITNATLNLFCWSATGASAPTAVCGGTDDTWTETGITFNSQPAFGAAIDTQTLASGVTSAWYTWNVTSFTQTKYAGNQLESLVLKPVTEGASSTTAYAFESREYSSNTPYLQITAQANGAPVPTVTQVQFYYRYSTDDSTWTPWTSYQTVNAAPWTVNFNYSNGYGYYEFYSVATDSNGTVEPAPAFADTSVHFTPGSITNPSTNLTSNGATAQGSYNPYGVDTTVYFNYGTTPSYGSSTTPQDIGSGSSIVNFGAPLTGLAPGTLYYVQAVIVQGGTTTYGTPQTFTTAVGVPAMPVWGWVGLGGALLLALRQLPRRQRASAARV